MLKHSISDVRKMQQEAEAAACEEKEQNETGSVGLAPINGFIEYDIKEIIVYD